LYIGMRDGKDERMTDWNATLLPTGPPLNLSELHT
jgi:hypothetical protein